ncbi:hypothetical protein ACFOZ6_09125, partial [Actinoplanes siamensis]
MPTAGPYRLERQLSRCEVGDVWSGAGERGRPVTVARLNELASADERWRGAFQAAAEALGQAGADRLPVTASDHAAERPWVACSGPEGSAAEIFTALGQTLEPVAPVPGPPPAAGETTAEPPADPVRAESAPAEPEPPTIPFQAVPRPASAQPVSAQPVSAQPVSAQPVSAQPVSGDSMSNLPAFGNPISAVPVSATPTSYPRTADDGPRPDRLLLLIVTLVSLLVGAAAGA